MALGARVAIGVDYVDFEVQLLRAVATRQAVAMKNQPAVVAALERQVCSDPGCDALCRVVRGPTHEFDDRSRAERGASNRCWQIGFANRAQQRARDDSEIRFRQSSG